MSEKKLEKLPLNSNLLTPQQVAYDYGIPIRTLESWRERAIDENKTYNLPFRKIGKNIRYRKDLLDEVMRESTFMLSKEKKIK